MHMLLWAIAFASTVVIPTTRPTFVMEGPTGSVTLVSDGYESVIDGVVHYTAFAQPLDGVAIETQGSCDVDGDGVEDLLDHWTSAQAPFAQFRDLVTGAIVLELDPPSSTGGYSHLPNGFACRDVDADGELDVVGSYLTGSFAVGFSNAVHIWNLDGSLRTVHTLPITGAPDMFAVGQLDFDDALEIVTAGKEVIDGVTGVTDGRMPNGFRVHLFDVDHDGIDEHLIHARDRWTMWDGGRQLWSRNDARNVPVIADFDGDGRVELVAAPHYTASAEGFKVYNARTGAIIHPQKTTRRCYGMWAHDGDGDGVSQIMCDDITHRVFDPIPGRLVMLGGQGECNRPVAGDLDGDGVDEVLWFGGADRILLRDADGTWLGQFTLPLGDTREANLLDVDGDGDVELVHNLDVYDWSPSTGLIRVGSLFPSPNWRGTVDHVGDLNGDGYDEILFHGSSGVGIIDLATGGTRLLGVLTLDRPTVFDMDRDGQLEILLSDTTTGRALIMDSAGTIEWETTAERVHLLYEAFRSIWMTCQDDTCTLFQWRLGGPVAVRHASPPGLANTNLRWVYAPSPQVFDGRLWFGSASGVHAWSPVLQSEEFFDTLGQHSWFTFAGGRLWRNEGNAVTGMEM